MVKGRRDRLLTFVATCASGSPRDARAVWDWLDATDVLFPGGEPCSGVMRPPCSVSGVPDDKLDADELSKLPGVLPWLELGSGSGLTRCRSGSWILPGLLVEPSDWALRRSLASWSRSCFVASLGSEALITGQLS